MYEVPFACLHDKEVTCWEQKPECKNCLYYEEARDKQERARAEAEAKTDTTKDSYKDSL
jgi:hypothetical protein